MKGLWAYHRALDAIEEEYLEQDQQHSHSIEVDNAERLEPPAGKGGDHCVLLSASSP